MVTRALGFSIQVLLFKSPLIVSGFLTTHGGQHGVIHLWDNYACDIVGIRPVNLQFQYDSVFTLQLVHHIPQLEKSFSTGQLDDDGFLTIFGDAKWKICKGFRVIARGYRSDTSYPLYVYSVSDHAVAVTEQPNVSLWHV